jgi:hypothetical protein
LPKLTRTTGSPDGGHVSTCTGASFAPAQIARTRQKKNERILLQRVITQSV